MMIFLRKHEFSKLRKREARNGGGREIRRMERGRRMRRKRECPVL